MPTITDEPKISVKEPIQPEKTGRPMAWPQAETAVPQYRPMFSDSLLERGLGEKKRRTRTTVFSFGLQCVLMGVLVIVPLWFVEDLPKGQLLTFLAAPPPPPPPPPPPAAPTVRVVRETDVLDNGALRTPTRIPKKVELIKEDEAPPPAPTGGVIGGIPGGVPGGQVGGVIGSILSATPTAIAPRIEPPKRIRVSQGVTQGLLLRKVEPAYPKIALAARVTGVVQVKAVIGKDGVIRELEVMSGHPLLVPAAMEALKQWRYRPYLLNGEAVEVETNITVTFQIAS